MKENSLFVSDYFADEFRLFHSLNQRFRENIEKRTVAAYEILVHTSLLQLLIGYRTVAYRHTAVTFPSVVSFQSLLPHHIFYFISYQIQFNEVALEIDSCGSISFSSSQIFYQNVGDQIYTSTQRTVVVVKFLCRYRIVLQGEFFKLNFPTCTFFKRVRVSSSITLGQTRELCFKFAMGIFSPCLFVFLIISSIQSSISFKLSIIKSTINAFSIQTNINIDLQYNQLQYYMQKSLCNYLHDIYLNKFGNYRLLLFMNTSKKLIEHIFHQFNLKVESEIIDNLLNAITQKGFDSSEVANLIKYVGGEAHQQEIVSSLKQSIRLKSINQRPTSKNSVDNIEQKKSLDMLGQLSNSKDLLDENKSSKDQRQIHEDQNTQKQKQYQQKLIKNTDIQQSAKKLSSPQIKVQKQKIPLEGHLSQVSTSLKGDQQHTIQGQKQESIFKKAWKSIKKIVKGQTQENKLKQDTQKQQKQMKSQEAKQKFKKQKTGVVEKQVKQVFLPVLVKQKMYSKQKDEINKKQNIFFIEQNLQTLEFPKWDLIIIIICKEEAKYLTAGSANKAKLKISPKLYKSGKLCVNIFSLNLNQSQFSSFEFKVKYTSSTDSRNQLQILSINDYLALYRGKAVYLADKTSQIGKTIINSNFSLFCAINYLVTKQIVSKYRNLEEMFRWMKLLNDNYKKQIDLDNQKQLFDELHSLVGGVDLSQWVIYFLYGIYQKETDNKIHHYGLIKHMELKSNYNVIHWQKSSHFTNLQNFYLKQLLYNKLVKSSTFQYIEAILKMNFKQQPPNIMKQIIIKISMQYPKMLTRSYETNNFLLNNPYISVEEWFSIKTRYLHYSFDNSGPSIWEDNGYQDKIILIGFFKQLNEKYQKSSELQRVISKQIPYSKQGLQNLFLKSTFWNRQNRQIRISEQKFCEMYYCIKKLYEILPQLAHIIMSLLIVKIQKHYKDLLQKFSFPLIAGMLINPIIKNQQQALMEYFTTHNFASKQILDILNFIDKPNHTFNITFLQKLLEEFMKASQNNKYFFELYHMVDFVNQIFTNGRDSKPRIYNIFHTILKYSHIDIKDINSTYKHIRSSFQLKDGELKLTYIKLICRQIRGEIRYEHELYQIVNRAIPIDQWDKREYFIIIFFQDDEQQVQQIQQKIWECFTTNIEYIGQVKARFGVTYDLVTQRITTKIAENNLLWVELDGLENGKEKMAKYVKKDLINSIEQCCTKRHIYYKKLKCVTDVLGKCQALIDVFSYFCKKQSDLRTKQLSDVYFPEIGEDEVWLLQNCYQLRVLMGYQFSVLSKSTNLEQIKINFSKQKLQFLEQMASVNQDKIQFQHFKKYFPVHLVQNLTEYLCPQQDLKKKLLMYSHKLNLQNLVNLLEYINSYIFISQYIKITVNSGIFNNFKTLLDKIKADQPDINVSESINIIALVEVQLGKAYDIKENRQDSSNLIKAMEKNDKIRIINSTYRAAPLFQMIEARKIDNKSIGDLKQYINDLEISALRMDSIKELQTVIDYWTLIKASKSIAQFLKGLQRKIQKNQQQIWQHIDNSFSIYMLIDQKLDEAANRQTSFKYDIESIFEMSTLIIKPCKDSVELQVITLPRCIGKPQVAKSESVIEYRKLQLFKEKSILLISDIERQQNPDVNTQNTLRVFKLYEEYFKIVERINAFSLQLVNYGYNPLFIIGYVKVQKSDFKDLLQKQQELFYIAKNWIEGIKDIYKQSYLLTHYIGPQLSLFISRCLNNQYHSSLGAILHLTKKQFLKETSKEQFKKIIDEAKRQDPLEQICSIVKAYSRFAVLEEMDEKGNNPIIIYNTQPKYFYCCLLEEDRIAQSSRVFYCLQSTKAEEIQIFLWRALIDHRRKYYFVAAHSLKEETRLSFCDILMNLHENETEKLGLSNLHFIDNYILDKLYSFLMKSKLFNFIKKEELESELQKRTASLIKCLSPTMVIESKKAGLGKTFRIEQLARTEGKNVKFFPLAGNIDFAKLGKRLKDMRIGEDDCLVLQVYEVENWQKVQVFLSELILFRCFYCEEYIFLPESLYIYVQMQNVHHEGTEEIYPLLAQLKRYEQAINIEQFQLHMLNLDDGAVSQEDKFVLIYLSLLDQRGVLNACQLHFYEIIEHSVPDNAQELLHKYFVSQFVRKKQEPTFTIYKAFMKMLFNAFNAFAESQHLKQHNFKVAGKVSQILQLDRLRESFLEICISNALQFLQQTFSSNDFSSALLYDTFTHQMNQISMLILPTFMGHYEFVYASDEKVPTCIKSILMTQNPLFLKDVIKIKEIRDLNSIFEKTALNNLPEILLEMNLQQKLNSIAQMSLSEQMREYYQPDFSEYKLTLDNFIKMCLIWLRAKSGIPCIIMGQSGVGKTKLISFFVKQILKNDLMVFNLHAGIHEEQIAEWVQKLRQNAEGWGDFNKVWAFFDQFNTCDELGYIKQMVVDHRFMGKPLPKNVIMVAACNPYRKKRVAKLVKAGISRGKEIQNEFAFKVKAPPLSMIQLMWDYQQLKQKENRIYIEKILGGLNYSKRQALIDSIVYAHEYLKDNVQISSVSLRDVARFKKIYEWFWKHMPKTAEKGRKANKSKNNYHLDRGLRAAVLTFSFCYCLRLSTGDQREHLYRKVQQKLNLTKGTMKDIVTIEQMDYVRRLKAPDEQIALNNALIEYVFGCLVCLLNKIPVLLIGNPGSSKSLSMRLIQSNLRGKGSPSEFCRQFPQLNVLYFQGSESSTSKGVQQIFQKATRWKNQSNKKWEIQQCILFDEIGLAEKSVHNPLKVLHAKLQNSSEQICFIGISNWELDLAKLSRFLVIAKSTPDVKDLSETALQIAKSYFEEDNNVGFLEYRMIPKQWQKLGEYYYKFVERWEKTKCKQNFYGLRDFYGYIKYICRQVLKYRDEFDIFQNSIQRSIEINFDGQPSSIDWFREVARLKAAPKMNPLELIKQNLERAQSRCLLLIVKGDSLVPLVNQALNDENNQRKIICIHGSTFAIDQESQQYNLEMTSLIIAHISRGSLLAFKDINNSIQTSLYDLFNKSFTRVGIKRYCRIAVGANSNPKCLVHHNFNAIVYVQQDRLQSLDPPFLNRFQKHYLNIENMVSREEANDLNEIKKWLQDLLSAKDKESLLKDEQFVLNCGKQALITLIIKHRASRNRVQIIKKQLLNNRTTDFDMVNEKRQYFQGQIYDYEVQKLKLLESKEDLIIFTYDQFLGLSEQSVFKKGYFIHLEEVQSQKQLRRQLKNGLQSDAANIQIFVNYQNSRQHISFLLFLSVQLKTSLGSDKQIIVILQMHRFSLHHLKIQHLNISYLHPFRQIFLESLNRKCLTQIRQVLEAKDYWEVYNILEMRSQFASQVTDTLKFTKFVSVTGNLKAEMQRLYFSECLELGIQPYFQEITLKSFQTMLSMQKIDLKILQNNNDDIISSSNVLEAIGRHVEDKVKQIIFEHIKAIVEKGILFHIRNKQAILLKHINQSFQTSFQKNNKLIRTMVQSQTKKIIMQISAKKNQNFKKRVEENVILIRQQLFLLPISIDDIERIFIEGGEETIEGIASKISLRQEEGNSTKLIIEHAHRFFESKFRLLEPSYAQIFQKQQLEELYLYDVIGHLLLINNRSNYKIQRLVSGTMQIFRQCSLPDKLMILGMDRTLTLFMFDLIEPLWDHKVFVKEIIFGLQQQKALKWKQQEWGPLMLALIQTMISIITGGINFPSTFLPSTSIKEYYALQKKIFTTISSIYTSFQEYGITYPLEKQVHHQFLQLLSHFDQKQRTLLIGRYEQQQRNGQGQSLCLVIFNILKDQISSQCLKTKELILSFCSYNIFSMWIKQARLRYADQFNYCIKNYLELANAYPIFSNHSNPFLQELLPISDILSINQFIQFCRSVNVPYLEQSLNYNNNISVAIGFYLSKNINHILKTQITQLIQYDTFEFGVISHYESLFDEIVTNFQKQPAIVYLSKIQFAKIYCLSYLVELECKRNSFQMMERIDRILSQNNNIAKHLRLSLLKHLTQKYGSLPAVRRHYIDIRRCDWILTLNDLIQEEKVQLLIPPLPMNKQLQTLSQTIKESKFTDLVAFHHLILQGLNSPVNTYHLLTYFMSTFYMRNCPEHYLPLLIQEVNNRGDLKQKPNRLIKELMIKYLKHRFNNRIYYQVGAKLQQVMFYLPLLNYINTLVACRKISSPLTQMFFKDGVKPLEYDRYIRQRYLLGTVPNPCDERINYILKLERQGFASTSYLACSQNCGYVTPVGGHFYAEEQNLGCGILDPGTTFKCPLCGKLSKIDENYDYKGRILTPKTILVEQEMVERKTSFSYMQGEQTIEYNLMGYQNGTTIQDLKDNLNVRQHLFKLVTDYLQPQQTFTAHKLLQSIIFMLWHLMVDTDQIEQVESSNIFKINKKQAHIFTYNASIEYFQSCSKLISSNNDQDRIIWHYALAKELLLNFTETIPQNDADLLLNYKMKINFEQWFGGVVNRMTGTEKQNIILQNRKMLVINKSEIVREVGNVQIHQQQYSMIRMFKLIKTQLNPSLQNMVAHSKQTINQNYPLLAYFLNEKINSKLVHFANIFKFVTRLLSLNLKITCSESNQSLQIIIEKYFSNTLEERNEVIQQMKQCIQSWNSLVTFKYKLRDGCLDLGYLQSINSQCPLSDLIIQKNHQHNLKGKKTLQFLVTASTEYNQICQIIQNLALRCNYQFMSELKMNPTIFTSQYFLTLPFDQINTAVDMYSNFSVEYGITQPQYIFDQIQALAVKSLNGCKYLINDKQLFEYISFIGEDSTFMLFISEEEQVIFNPETDLRLKEYFKKQKIVNRGETFCKFIKQLLGSLQNIIVCYKNKKNFSLRTIGQFINYEKFATRMRMFSRELTEDPLQSVALSNIGALYELIQSFTFDSIQDLLAPVYKQALSYQEKQNVVSLLKTMKQEVRPVGLPHIGVFKQVLNRFASRSLMIMIAEPKHLLCDHICELFWLWPKKYNFENLSVNLKMQMGNISVSKVSEILKLASSIEVEQQIVQKQAAPFIPKPKIEAKPVNPKKKRDRY